MAPRAPQVELFQRAPPPPPRRRQEDLLERYLGGDVSRLLADAEARPTHYTSDEHDLLLRLRTGRPTRPDERSALVLSFVRDTTAQRKERDTRTRMTRDFIAPEQEPPPFEKQEDFTGAIGLI